MMAKFIQERMDEKDVHSKYIKLSEFKAPFNFDLLFNGNVFFKCFLHFNEFVNLSRLYKESKLKESRYGAQFLL